MGGGGGGVSLYMLLMFIFVGCFCYVFAVVYVCSFWGCLFCFVGLRLGERIICPVHIPGTRGWIYSG